MESTKYLQLISVIQLLNSKQLNSKQQKKSRMPTPTELTSNTVLDVLATAISEENEIKGIWIRKEKISIYR